VVACLHAIARKTSAGRNLPVQACAPSHFIGPNPPHPRALLRALVVAKDAASTKTKSRCPGGSVPPALLQRILDFWFQA
jgi:hypothetical protein